MPAKPKTYRPATRPCHKAAPQRPSAAKRGYGRGWQALRLSFLADHPLCVECRGRGLVVAATEVDHVTPHKGDPALFWNSGNLQGLCHTCHSRKTVADDGGLGRPPRT